MKQNNDNKLSIEIYQPKKGHPLVKVYFTDETLWLNQARLVKLFQRDQSVISRHINNIFREGELKKKQYAIFAYC